MFMRMVIGEANNETPAADLIGQAVEHGLLSEVAKTFPAGMVSARALHEEDGRMVIFEFMFETREAAVRFSADRVYRSFVSKTSHYLVGDFVTKLFAVV